MLCRRNFSDGRLSLWCISFLYPHEKTFQCFMVWSDKFSKLAGVKRGMRQLCNAHPHNCVRASTQYMHAPTHKQVCTHRRSQICIQIDMRNRVHKKSNCQFLRLVFPHYDHMFSYELQFCKRVCPSDTPTVGPSICWSGRWSVGPLVGPSVGYFFFSGQKWRRRTTYAAYPALLISTI